MCSLLSKYKEKLVLECNHLKNISWYELEKSTKLTKSEYQSDINLNSFMQDNGLMSEMHCESF